MFGMNRHKILKCFRKEKPDFRSYIVYELLCKTRTEQSFSQIMYIQMIEEKILKMFDNLLTI